jgi:WD40 repeat protein
LKILEATSMSQRYDVFLSHSSADKPAVETLALKLREAGLEPFLDKWHLVPGKLWQPGLEEGLRNSRACIVFVGSEGIGPLQRQEMLVAIDRGAKDPDFRVIPVLLPGSRKPTGIPDFLAQRTWVEFPSVEDDDAFQRLLSGIRGEEPGAGGRGGPAKSALQYRCMAQPPEGWIHRREYDEVLEALCSNDGAQAERSVGITTALRGAGGFGKTALAQKLCFDERVRKAYPDGILWATMGEEIDSNGRLRQIRDLLRWWNQEEPPAFETVAAAGAKLRESLNGARALVVVDDVWSQDDIAPLQGLGESCALLITTRDSRTLPADSKPIQVDAMASPEAVDLLRAGLPSSSPEDFISLAAHLGEWPLLLKLVNGPLREMVNEGLSISEALQEIEGALATEGFAAFDQSDSASRHAAASRAILVSVRRLPEAEQEFFFQLAIFQEDEDIPVSVLERYWGLSHFGTTKTCQHLHDLSLLLGFDRKNGTIRLHDVTRRVLMEQRTGELSSLHSRLLEICRPASGKWEDLSHEESYLWRRLRDHFLGAGWASELKTLLLSFSFIEAKLRATDINSVIADYEPFAEEDQELRLAQAALRLSSHVLAMDRKQLASQLLGRLLGRKELSLHSLLEGARSWRGNIWFRPRTGSLTQAGGALIRTLRGHTSGANAVAVHGRCIISASRDGTLRVWDLDTGKTLQVFEGHKARVNAVAMVDNQHAVSASNDNTLRVWDLETGQSLQTLEGHTSWVRAVAVVDSHRVVSASLDLTLQVWDLETGQTLQTLAGHTGRVDALAMVDDRRIVSASFDRTLRVWDLESGQTLQTLKGHRQGITAVAVIDDHRIVSASFDGTLRVWDLETGQTLRIVKVNKGPVTSVAVVDGCRIISTSHDGTLWVWDLETGLTLQSFQGHTDWVRAVVVVDGRCAVSASDDRTLRVWDLEIGGTLQASKAKKVNAVAVVDDQRALSADQRLRVWDLKTGQTIRTLKRHQVTAVAVIDNYRAICVSGDRKLWVLDLETRETLQTLEGHTSWVASVAVVDGRRAVSASGDRTLRVWDLESGQTLQTLKGHTSGVRAVAVVDGRRAVSASDDCTLRAWDLESGQTLQTLEGHTSGVRAVAVVDGRRAVSASGDRTLRVWDLESGQTLQTLEGHTSGVRAVAMVDGRRAVSGSDDRTIRVWDLESGKTLAVMTLDAPVLAVAASLDGGIIVAGDGAGSVHFFDLVEPE